MATVNSEVRLHPASVWRGSRDSYPLGTFDLPAGEVRVTVSDRTSGPSVPADAIRWLPAESYAAEQ